MHESHFIGQDPSVGAYAAILRGIATTWEAASFTRSRAAVAYVSAKGARTLNARLGRGDDRWDDATKEWIVSIDFGTTEPAALSYLRGLPHSEVRVANAAEVLERGLRPVRCVHPKTYIFDESEGGADGAFGLVVGSANLTRSALKVGTEHAIRAHWVPPLTRRDRALLRGARLSLAWWNAAWRSSETIDDAFIAEYADRRRARPQLEDSAPIVGEVSGQRERELTKRDAATWSSARCFWIRTLELNPNLGEGRAGNQVDCARGTRTYFGFSADVVPRNTTLGEVMLQCDGHPPVSKSIRFGDNQMDKVNLPVPGEEGPESYDNVYLHFERVARQRFRLTIGSDGDAATWRAASQAQSLYYQMRGRHRREYGFYS